MIDFSKITKTLDGYDCHYFGTRESYGTKLHCFGVWTPTGLYEKCYDDQGRHLAFSMDGTWEVSKTDAFAIAKLPKIVEVTRWVALYSGNTINDKVVCCYEKKPELQEDTLDIQQYTFRFEVHNE